MRQLIFLLLVGILIAGAFAMAEEISEETVPITDSSGIITPENAGDLVTPCGGGSSDGGGGAPG